MKKEARRHNGVDTNKDILDDFHIDMNIFILANKCSKNVRYIVPAIDAICNRDISNSKKKRKKEKRNLKLKL